MEMLSSVIMSVVMAVLISGVTFAGKVQKGEPFDLLKLARTLLIGVVLGVIAGFSGFQLTAENWEMYAAANAGAVAIVDQLFKAGLRVVMPKNTAFDFGIMALLIVLAAGYASSYTIHHKAPDKAENCHTSQLELPAELPEL